MGKIVGQTEIKLSGTIGLEHFLENSFLLGTAKAKQNFNDDYPKDNENSTKFYPFRQLSKTIVGRGTASASDFSEGNVLFDSLPLIANIPACFDHSYGSIYDIVGSVISPYWQEESIQEGKIVPAGINATFAINQSLSEEVERICKLLDSEFSPTVGSSVTLYFDFKVSHEGFNNVQALKENLGRMGGDGQMIRRIATKIHKFKESSIVFAGADMFAKRQKTSPSQFSETDPFLTSFKIQDEDMVEVGKYFVIEKLENSLFYQTQMEKEPTGNTVEKTLPTVQIGEQSFQEVFGVEFIEDLTNETLEKAFDSFAVVPKNEYAKLKQTAEIHDTMLGQFADLKQTKEIADKQIEKQIVSFKEIQNSLIGTQADLKNKEKEVDVLKSFADEYRSTVEKAYRLSLKDKEADNNVLDKIQNGSLSEVNTFAGLFSVSLSDSFGLKCQTCGGTDVKFGSSVSTQKTDVNPKYNGRFGKADKIRSKYHNLK